tara:strand:+ start:351 stop:680 length:330 start_codon:yes stop_codon:yes gene_type:complete
MSKYKKVTYCSSCGNSNPWVLSKASSLLEAPNFCSSCGASFKGAAKKLEKREVKAETEETEEVEETIEISTNIPPLELDIEGCVFGAKKSQTLSNLMRPVPEESPEDGG